MKELVSGTQVQVPARCTASEQCLCCGAVAVGFLTPQCGALRCLWMSALVVPVVRLAFLFTANVQKNCATVHSTLGTKKNDDHERTTRPIFHIIYWIYGPGTSHVIHPSLARKRTGDAEIGWRPTPEKNIETMPCWGKKNSPENCLVDLGRDTRTSTQSRRLVRRKGASWSLNWPSGANSLAHLQLKCILYVPL